MIFHSYSSLPEDTSFFLQNMNFVARFAIIYGILGLWAIFHGAASHLVNGLYPQYAPIIYGISTLIIYIYIFNVYIIYIYIIY